MRQASQRSRIAASNRGTIPRSKDTQGVLTAVRMKTHLAALGLDPTAAVNRALTGNPEGAGEGEEGAEKKGRKRGRSVEGRRDEERMIEEAKMEVGGKRGRGRSKSVPRLGDDDDDADMAVDGEEGAASGRRLKKRLRLMSRSRTRSLSRGRTGGSVEGAIGEVVPGEGFKDRQQKVKAVKLGRVSLRQKNQQAKRGEADRTVVNLRPKHLFSGKRSAGKTDRR